MDAAELVQQAGNSIVSGLFGYVAALATFRLKLTLVDVRLDNLRAELAAERKHDKEMLAMELAKLGVQMERDRTEVQAWGKRIERRQSVTLELVAHMATKAGISHRALGVDALAKLLSEGIDSDETVV